MNLFSSYDNYTYYAHYLLLLKLSDYYPDFFGRNVKKHPAQTAEPPVSADAEPPVSEPFPFIPSTGLL